MNLKEAFRYQNKLDTFFQSITNYLNYSTNVMVTKQEHLRSKANPDATDETVDMTKDRKISYPVNKLIEFAVHIISEKSKLSEEIENTKKTCGLNIDSAILLNKRKQELSKVFSNMANIKAVERITQGRANKFNVEGNQVSYTYDINEVSTIDFDRNKVKVLSKKYTNEADEISTQIDKIMIDCEVNFTPTYDMNDTFEDALEQFAESN